MKAFVTGADGFIGTHLCAALVRDGWDVVRYDKPFDVLTIWRAQPLLQGTNIVFHLAALADVRNALKQPTQQVESNLLLTSKLLEAMRDTGVNRLVFTSSAVVYGDCPDGLITERATCFPQQTSIYGAMKLASESLIAAYCHGYGMTADILRLVSVMGAGYRHGNVMDFYQKLKADPTRLELFGDPRTTKYYTAVDDVVAALLLVAQRDHAGAELWNVSHDQPSTIQDSIDAVCAGMTLNSPAVINKGDPWAGDLPGLVLDCAKLRALGWAPTVPIRDAMAATVQDFIDKGL